jgi:hypothetical protein
MKENPLRFLDPSKFTLSLKCVEEETKDATAKAESKDKDEGDEWAEIQQFEKSVNIRFANYSMIVRAT